MYKPLLDALAAAGAPASKDLDQFVSAPGGQLNPGTYHAVIASVDMTSLQAEGRFKIPFEDLDGGGTHSQSIWPVERDGKTLSRTFLNWCNALFGRPEFYDELAEAGTELGDAVWNLFRGLKVGIVVTPGPGYRIHVADRQFRLVDATTGAVMFPDQPPFNTETDARRFAEARGLKRSYNRVTRYEPVSTETMDANWQAFLNGRRGLAAAIAAGVRAGASASPTTEAAASASGPAEANTR